MKICIYIPGGDSTCTLDFPSRGETRWSLNWAYVLEKWGHEVHKIGDFDRILPGTEYDLFLNAPWFSEYACYNDRIRFKKHLHLCFGGFTPGILDTVCHMSGGPCAVVSPYMGDYRQALRAQAPEPFQPILMPTPYSEAMFPLVKDDPFLRREISCLSKELWHPGLMERSPQVYRCALYQFKALLEFQKHTDFTFNLVDQNIDDAPEEAKNLLREVKNLNVFRPLPFTRMLGLLNKSKLLLPIGGTIGSSPEGCFTGALPLSNKGNVLNSVAVDKGLCLPYATECTLEDFIEKMSLLWFSRDKYEQLRNSFEEEFKHHREEYAKKYFEEMLEKLV